jgi:hypothetical protein
MYDPEYEKRRDCTPARVIQNRRKRATYRDKNRMGIRQTVADRLKENNAFVAAYLACHPCVDCGHDDVDVLEFDHRDPKDKSFNISKRRGETLKALEAEVAKCDIRCANCHRKRHAAERRAGVCHGALSYPTPQLALF